MSSCLTLSSSNLDITYAGLDPRTCNNVTLSGSLTVSGTWSANSDGTYTDGTMTKGTAHLALPPGCLMLSGTTTKCAQIGGPFAGLGFANVTCTDAPGGGCSCEATVQQSGLPGVVSVNASASGSYMTSGNTVTLVGMTPYASCVSGTTMTWTPQTTSPTTSGTIAFQKGNSMGAGGATGGGGTTGTGGNGTAGAGGFSTGNGGSSTAGVGGTSGGNTGAGGSTGGTGTGGSGPTNRSDGPCDIYAAANTSCGAAYSTIRALSKAYTGPLYQVRNGSSAMNTGSGGMTKDIGQTADGFADTAAQDTFCNGSICTFSIIYDQSGNGNNLKAAAAGLTNGGQFAAMPDFESSATKGMLMISGHKVYSLYMAIREGYRTPVNVKAKNVPMGNTAQGLYELADGTHAGNACCWDFGSVSPDPTKYVTMNTLFFGTGFWDKGAGAGPWFMADLEGGVWAGGTATSTGNINNSNPSMKVPFALGILHSPVGKYALRMADVKTATDLTTAYDGNLPSNKTWGNAGGIVLGVGGDNSNNSWGTFYEGALTNGSPSNATDLQVMKNIQAAGYGK